MRTYKITRPYFALNPRHDGEKILCRHLQDKSIVEYRPYFETFNWEEIFCDSINDCMKVLGDFHGVDWVTKFFIMSEVDGYTVYTYDNDRTTIDGQETYANGLSYVAEIKGFDL